MNPLWPYLDAKLSHLRGRTHNDADAGVVSTETAVVTSLVVAGAIIIVGLLMTAAQDTASSIPTP